MCWYISLDQDCVAHTNANMKKMMESLGEGKGATGRGRSRVTLMGSRRMMVCGAGTTRASSPAACETSPVICCYRARAPYCHSIYVLYNYLLYIIKYNSPSQPRIDMLCSCLCSVAESCPSLCNPVDYSLPGSFMHGILQVRILE